MKKKKIHLQLQTNRNGKQDKPKLYKQPVWHQPRFNQTSDLVFCCSEKVFSTSTEKSLDIKRPDIIYLDMSTISCTSIQHTCLAVSVHKSEAVPTNHFCGLCWMLGN